MEGWCIVMLNLFQHLPVKTRKKYELLCLYINK